MDMLILFIIVGCCLVFYLMKVLNGRQSNTTKAAYAFLVMFALLLGAEIYNDMERANSIAQMQKRQFAPNEEQEKVCLEMKNIISTMGKFYASEDRLPRALAELTIKSGLDINNQFEYNTRDDSILFWRSPEHYELSFMDSEGNTFYYTNGDYNCLDPQLSEICWVGKIAVIKPKYIH